jgi:predicted nucleic acid-binding protein
VIFVDTSVWIDFFNGKDSAEVQILDSALGTEAVAIGDLIALEILQGFKNDKDYKAAKEMMDSLTVYDLLGESAVYACAENYRALRKKGITIRKTADVIIATFCIENNFPLLFSDRDFLPFIEHLGLRSALTYT